MIRYFLNFCFVVLYAASGLAQEDLTVDLTAETFQTELSQKPYFVMFYAPWCGHCKKVMPTWSKLAGLYNQEEEIVTIARLDCTLYPNICAEHEVSGYPTFKLFVEGTEGIKFRPQNRDFETFNNFIEDEFDLAEEDDIDVPDASSQKPVESKVVELTSESFKEKTKSAKFFVKFYAPWCGYCQQLAPIWDSLSNEIGTDLNVVIAKLDCTQHKDICTEFEVRGYPSLRWIENGKMVDRFVGHRALANLKEFVLIKLGLMRDEDDDEEEEEGHEEETEEDEVPSSTISKSAVVPLTAENIENAISKDYTFVMYFAPWCGHCKSLAPTYEELAKKFVAVAEVTIAKVDCTLEVNKELCSKEKVTGFPTLLLYRNGVKMTTYKGDRTLDGLIEFIASKIQHTEL